MIPKRIIVHHSLTKDSETVSWGAIEDYHVKTLGWSAIGYHAGVELARDRYHVFMGRPWDRQGAHAKGHNADSLGVCFVGNYDSIEPTAEMLLRGAEVVKLWMRLFHIPATNIIGHRDVSSKTCPGLKFNLFKFKEMCS